MFERVKVLGYELEIDKQATIAAYKGDYIDCDDIYSQNFREAWKYIPRALVDVMETMGINPVRFNHVTHWTELKDGIHLYSVKYNIVGKIVSSPEIPDPHKLFTSDDYEVLFHERVNFPDGFPEPRFEMEIFVHLPWVHKDPPEQETLIQHSVLHYIRRESLAKRWLKKVFFRNK